MRQRENTQIVTRVTLSDVTARFPPTRAHARVRRECRNRVTKRHASFLDGMGFTSLPRREAATVPTATRTEPRIDVSNWTSVSPASPPIPRAGTNWHRVKSCPPPAGFTNLAELGGADHDHHHALRISSGGHFKLTTMTLNERKTGWGGARRGAGRKPQGINSLRGVRTSQAVSALPKGEPLTAESLLPVALACLRDVAANSPSARARVAAARELASWAREGLE